MLYVTSFERFAREEGLEEGLILGREQGSTSLLMRILSKQCGELSDDLQTSIRGLKLEQSHCLGEALLEFRTVDDLVTWLRSNTSSCPTLPR